MTDFETLISALRIPAGIASIISLGLFLYRLKLFTLVTSTPVEKILLTKESRIFVTFLSHLFHTLVATFLITILSFFIYYYKIPPNNITAYSFAILLIPIYLFYTVNKKSYRQSPYIRRLASKNTLINVTLIYIGLFYIFISYYVGAFVPLDIKMLNNYFFFVFTACISLIISAVLVVPLTNSAIAFLNEKFGKIPPLFINLNYESDIS